MKVCKNCKLNSEQNQVKYFIMKYFVGKSTTREEIICTNCLRNWIRANFDRIIYEKRIFDLLAGSSLDTFRSYAFKGIRFIS